jgi:hypothetical protein
MAWAAQSIGRLCLDLETFADPRYEGICEDGVTRLLEGVDLGRDGVYNYARHPLTGCWMAGFGLSMECRFVAVFWKLILTATGRQCVRKTEAELFREYPLLQACLEAIANGCWVTAHNATFEYLLWNGVVRRYFPHWPELTIKRLDCTMARANAMCLPAGLDNLCKVLRTRHQKKDSSLMKLMAVSNPGTIAVVTPENLAEEAIYCDGDLLAEMELDAMLYPLPPLQRRVWEIDQEINMRGIPIDVLGVRKAVQIVDAAKQLANARIAALTGGAVKTGQQTAALMGWINQRLRAAKQPELPNMQAYTLESYDEETGWPADEVLEEVLELREATSRASAAKLQTVLDQLRLSPDGRLRGMYIFMGAGTGRWTARSVQPQNFVRFDDDTQPLADTLLEVLHGGTCAVLVDAGATGAARWKAALAAAAEIEQRTGKNAIVAIGKCMRVFIKAPENMEMAA